MAHCCRDSMVRPGLSHVPGGPGQSYAAGTAHDRRWERPHLQQRNLDPERAAGRTAGSCGSLSHIPVWVRPLL